MSDRGNQAKTCDKRKCRFCGENYKQVLDERGTPRRAIKVCEELSQRFGLHVFAPTQASARLHETAELDLGHSAPI